MSTFNEALRIMTTLLGQDHRNVANLEDAEGLSQEAVSHDGHEYRAGGVDGVDVAHRDDPVDLAVQGLLYSSDFGTG